jgi:quercetin dioxygenase-like cupin family protein
MSIDGCRSIVRSFDLRSLAVNLHRDLELNPIHLGLGATAEVEPVFTGELHWYEGYAHRHLRDGAEGRLVTLHVFDAPWDTWEMHPHGAEVVLCTAGRMTLHQEDDEGRRTSIVLNAGQYAINPPGVWHTADVSDVASAVFITAGLGTQHRPR